jgi:ADP-ribose pyrophosphatase YjhB (NUDIX family)
MRPSQLFRHCPRCGQPGTGDPPERVFDCPGCGFRFFFSASNAVAVFVTRADGRALFIRRARDPGKDRLAPPGGFIDIGESAEDAARREIREEVGLELGPLAFLVSHPNTYPYAGVTYPVLDLFFTAPATHAEAATALDDVAGFAWLDPKSVAPEEMAFVSMQHALRTWQSRLATP